MAYLLAREKKLPRRADERAWKWQEEKAGEEERHSLYKLGSFRIELPKLWLVLHYFPSLIHLSSSYGKVSFCIDMCNDAAARLLLSLARAHLFCVKEKICHPSSAARLWFHRGLGSPLFLSLLLISGPCSQWPQSRELKASSSLGSGLMLPTLGIVGGPFCHCVLANGMGKKAWVG